ncbi:MAG: DUF503 domain-containing protein [candidate division WOR-3 bacterium]
MIVGVLEVEIFIPYSNSIKEKRYVLKSIKDKVKSRFNVSVAELDYQDTWQRSKVGFACIGNSANYVNEHLIEVLKFLEDDRRFEITLHKLIWL